jgi:hypothetical protein
MTLAFKPQSPQSDGRSLYALGIAAQDIAGEIAAAAELLDDPDTEQSAQGLIETYLQAQHANELALLGKADNVCRYIDHLNASAQFRADQAKRLKELADADFKRAEALKKYLLGVLTTLHPEQVKFSLPTHEIRSRRTESVVIDDPEDLPEDLTRVKREPDKAAIKAALKAGVDVHGASLQSNTSWTIK